MLSVVCLTVSPCHICSVKACSNFDKDAIKSHCQTMLNKIGGLSKDLWSFYGKHSQVDFLTFKKGVCTLYVTSLPVGFSRSTSLPEAYIKHK